MPQDHTSPRRDNRATWWTTGVLGLAMIAAISWRLTGADADLFQGLEADPEGVVEPGWARVEGSLDTQGFHKLPRLDRGANELSDVDFGGTVLLNVWASWCGPCTEELPLLARLDRTTDVNVVGLSRDPLESGARDALENAGTAYPNTLDQSAKFSETLAPIVGTQYVPVSILLEDGEATWAHFGSFESYEELRRSIASRTPPLG